MKRAVVILIALVCGTASAHVGSPDVFYEGDAGPYHLFVTVRMPQVIPGVAEIDVRASDSDVSTIDVVPLRLTGPGSELPPAPDRADRDLADPQSFTASLWLMEHGSLQARITVGGARGDGVLAVPLAAAAQRTLGMNRTLGAVLLGFMLLIALALVSIAAAAVREAALEPGAQVTAPARRRSRITAVLAGAVVVALLAFGKAWWASDARTYESMVAKPWKLDVTREGCTLSFPPLDFSTLPDHGHDAHLFVVRVLGLDRLGHLHPVQGPDGRLFQSLPSLPAGRYALFLDVVATNGFPVTGTAEITLPDLTCAPLAGDDSAWAGEPSDLVFDRPAQLHANVPAPLRFHAGGPIEPYMGMAGHAVVIRTDLSVFAHLHPSGSVAMPALMLAHAPHAMFPEGTQLPPEVRFPYAFPQAGHYRVFVQVKRAGAVETGAFDVDVAP